MKALAKLKPTEESQSRGDMRVIGIDPSSNSLAFSCLERVSGVETLIMAGKLVFDKNDTLQQKFKKTIAFLDMIYAQMKPDLVIVEETVYLQNPNTTRVLAYFVGNIMGCTLHCGYNIIDVGPLRWKPYLGYKNVTKKDIAIWAKEIGEKEAKKKASFERKNRIKNILEEMMEIEINDHDVADAIGIGIWGLRNG